MSQTVPRHVTLEAGEYAVLALHGLRSTPLELQPVLKSLHAAGMTVFAPHMPGYGFSNEPDTGPWQQWLTEALAHFDERSPAARSRPSVPPPSPCPHCIRRKA